jgi:putative ABC transport system permease protein
VGERGRARQRVRYARRLQRHSRNARARGVEGGVGAYERRDQSSHRFLEDELAEQETLAIVTPAIFFGIAAFLLNVVLGRLIEAQREQIASLKALGFPAAPIAWHYLKFASAIAIGGSLFGIGLGLWMAAKVIEAYRPFFRFPSLETEIEPWVLAVAIAVSLAAAIDPAL